MAEDIKVTADELKIEIHETFSRLYLALKNREKQMLRQIDVLWQQCQQSSINSEKKSLDQFGIKFDNENKLCDEVSKFGELDLSNFTLDSNLYAIEDYICPKVDHECMYKCLDTLNIVSSTEDLNIQVEFPQYKNLNLTFNNNKHTHNGIVSKHLTTDQSLSDKLYFAINDEEFDKFSDSLKEIKSITESPEISKEKNTKDFKCYLNETASPVSYDSSEPSSPMNDSKQNMKHHPTQVQHWLKQIITETEIEPVLNIEKQLIIS